MRHMLAGQRSHLYDPFPYPTANDHRRQMAASIQSRVESWIRDQRSRLASGGGLSWPRMRWPWQPGREERQRMQEEFERRRRQLQDLCRAVKTESVSDLQDILCSMVLSECVYKRPATEIVRVVNKFKADFGGQIVSLERVQVSQDHVSHRYLLAESGDTLFASFIGTKQYKDIFTDANILQGAIFHEDCTEDAEEDEIFKLDQGSLGNSKRENLVPLQSKAKSKGKAKPAAHRGFLARAKGIPGLELYRLAQKKNRKLVLCGHSLGGAVAALSTLAILRVIAASSLSKPGEKVSVKCITFSQPPVGNEALRDYVHRKGWQAHFKSYCIPEDLVPRILSPAYFHHYNSQNMQSSFDLGSNQQEESFGKKIKVDGEQQLVLGLGPVQNSFWRLSRLVPLEGVQKQFSRLKGSRNQQEQDVKYHSSVDTNPVAIASLNNGDHAPQSLEILEGSDGVSLTPLPDANGGPLDANSDRLAGKNDARSSSSGRWHRMPSLPSYVPFGELYLLGNSTVEALSDSEYSKLTSMKSVITELRERFPSHSMKSYRSRFQKIYDLCMCANSSAFLGMEQLPQFPHLQQWLGLAVAGSVELGHIVESPVIKTATSLVPLGWYGVPGAKNVGPLKVDITGYGLHLCTLVQAQVNGEWCSTEVESLPSVPSYSSNSEALTNLQKMRVLVGPRLRWAGKDQLASDSSSPMFPSLSTDSVDSFHCMRTLSDENTVPEDLLRFVVSCTSDFVTVSKEVFLRTRKVRFVGLEGSGKTSLLNAILGQGQQEGNISSELSPLDVNNHKAVAGGVCYSVSKGVNLQELHSEAARFRDELWSGVRDLRWKTDLVVLVHNLSHKIPVFHHPTIPEQEPALALLLKEVKSLGIPWVLAITNKFSVSAHLQNSAINAVLKAYQVPPSMTAVINSCPYVMSSNSNSPRSWGPREEKDPPKLLTAQKLLLAPFNFVRMPFQKREFVLPVEGVNTLCHLVRHVLREHEETSYQELADERLSLVLANEQAARAGAAVEQESKEKGSSLTAAAVGASLGAGLGLVLAVVMGAASALRKP